MQMANDNLRHPRCCECLCEVRTVQNEPDLLPGDVTVCAECAALNVCTGDLRLRAPTDEERRKAEVNDEIRKLQDTIARIAALKGRQTCSIASK